MFIRTYWCSSVVLIVALLAACAPAVPPELSLTTSSAPESNQYGTISGVVTDNTKEPIAGATIFLQGAEKGSGRGTATDITGIFVLRQLPPGVYTLSIEAAGFNKVEDKQIAIQPGTNLRVAASLPPSGPVIQLIEDPPMIDRRSTTSGIVVYNAEDGLPRVENK